MDRISKKQRSRNMSKIRSINTKPEKAVRSFLHKKGFRFRINSHKLPGKPDIVLTKYSTVIFVHGCFWHQHDNCKYAYLPKSNKDYWLPKLNRNIERDKQVQDELKKNGWKIIIIWECEIKNIDHLPQLILNIKNN